MTTFFVDTSVVLPSLMGMKSRVRELQRAESFVVSVLVELEVLRTIARWRLAGTIEDEGLIGMREKLAAFLRRTALVDVSTEVLSRAKTSFPTPIASMDAIHLASAILWRESQAEPVVFATHDVEQGTAARAVGFKVVGLKG